MKRSWLFIAFVVVVFLLSLTLAGDTPLSRAIDGVRSGMDWSGIAGLLGGFGFPPGGCPRGGCGTTTTVGEGGGQDITTTSVSPSPTACTKDGICRGSDYSYCTNYNDVWGMVGVDGVRPQCKYSVERIAGYYNSYPDYPMPMPYPDNCQKYAGSQPVTNIMCWSQEGQTTQCSASGSFCCCGCYGNLTGNITNTNTGHGFKNVKIMVFYPNTRIDAAFPTKIETTTDSDGNYRIDNIPVPCYDIGFGSEGSTTTVSVYAIPPRPSIPQTKTVALRKGDNKLDFAIKDWSCDVEEGVCSTTSNAIFLGDGSSYYPKYKLANCEAGRCPTECKVGWTKEAEYYDAYQTDDNGYPTHVPDCRDGFGGNSFGCITSYSQGWGYSYTPGGICCCAYAGNLTGKIIKRNTCRGFQGVRIVVSAVKCDATGCHSVGTIAETTTDSEGKFKFVDIVATKVLVRMEPPDPSRPIETKKVFTDIEPDKEKDIGTFYMKDWSCNNVEGVCANRVEEVWYRDEEGVSRCLDCGGCLPYDPYDGATCKMPTMYYESGLPAESVECDIGHAPKADYLSWGMDSCSSNGGPVGHLGDYPLCCCVDYGNVSVKVYDGERSKPICGITVVLTISGDGKTAKYKAATNSSGHARFVNLPAGIHTNMLYDIEIPETEKYPEDGMVWLAVVPPVNIVVRHVEKYHEVPMTAKCLEYGNYEWRETGGVFCGGGENVTPTCAGCLANMGKWVCDSECKNYCMGSNSVRFSQARTGQCNENCHISPDGITRCFASVDRICCYCDREKQEGECISPYVNCMPQPPEGPWW